MVNPNRITPPVPPIALDLLASALENEGFSIDILDLNIEKKIKTAIEKHSSKNYFAIGISIRNIDNVDAQNPEFYLQSTKRIINMVKKIPHSYLIVGGSGFSSVPKEIFKYLNVDFGIVGDGEEVLPQLLKKLLNKDDFDDLPGLVYKKNDSVHYNVAENGYLKETSNIHRKFVNNCWYYQKGGLGSIQTKRGCNKKCIYCLDPVLSGGEIRTFSFNYIKSQIEELIQNKIFSFYICDSEFNNHISHAENICKCIINQNWNKTFNWFTYMTPKPFSDKFGQLLKDSGCRGIAFAADHINEKMLKTLGKDYTKEDIENCIRICKKNQIHAMVHLLFGGPGETKETIKESIMFCKKNLPDAVRISVGIRVYPQTELEKIVMNEGFNTNNRNLKGIIKNNEELVKPVFYLSDTMGNDIDTYIRDLIQMDKRFLYRSPHEQANGNKKGSAAVKNKPVKSDFNEPYWYTIK